MSEEIDFNKALDALRDGQDLTGKDGILTPLIKQLTKAEMYGLGISNAAISAVKAPTSGYRCSPICRTGVSRISSLLQSMA